MNRDSENRIRMFELVAIFALALAASSGVLLRFGFVTGMPSWAANFGAVRHAHSHLMYFGWVTLALMAQIWRLLPAQSGRPLPRGVFWQMGASAFLALLSFPAFWSNGYGLTRIGGADLPLGSMVAALNGLSWYAFVLLYVRATWGVRTRGLPMRLWDWAIGVLVLSSAGAIGVAGLVVLDQPNPFLQQLFLHLFLDLFAVGWFGLALLGNLWAGLATQRAMPEELPSHTLGLLVIPTFVLGMSSMLVTEPLFWVAALANAGAALLLGRHALALWKRSAELSPIMRFGLAALAVHTLGALVVLWPEFWRWSAGTQLRVFYLHNLLLAWVSSALLAALPAVWMSGARVMHSVINLFWIGGVALMVLALLGLGFIQVAPLGAATLLHIAAWSSVLPAAAAWLALLVAARGGYGTP